VVGVREPVEARARGRNWVAGGPKCENFGDRLVDFSGAGKTGLEEGAAWR